MVNVKVIMKKIKFKYKDKVYKITGMFADYIALSNVIRDKMKNNEYLF